jgi:hypothetical protein
MSISALRSNYKISEETWKSIIQAVRKYLLFTDLFPEFDRHSDTNIVQNIMNQHKLSSNDAFGAIYNTVGIDLTNQ